MFLIDHQRLQKLNFWDPHLLFLHGFREGLDFFRFHHFCWNSWDLFMHLVSGSLVCWLLFCASAKGTYMDFLRSPFVLNGWPRKCCNHDVFCLLILLVFTRVCPSKCSSVALNMRLVLPPISNRYRKANFGVSKEKQFRWIRRLCKLVFYGCLPLTFPSFATFHWEWL